jgi:hypothetical protein
VQPIFSPRPNLHRVPLTAHPFPAHRPAHKRLLHSAAFTGLLRLQIPHISVFQPAPQHQHWGLQPTSPAREDGRQDRTAPQIRLLKLLRSRQCHGLASQLHQSRIDPREGTVLDLHDGGGRDGGHALWPPLGMLRLYGLLHREEQYQLSALQGPRQ